MAQTTTKRGTRFFRYRGGLNCRAYIAAAKRKDRSKEGKIESAKKSSEAHYETHGRFFYLTEEIILSNRGAFEELEEEEQFEDPELILPDNVTREEAFEDLCAKTEALHSTFQQHHQQQQQQRMLLLNRTMITRPPPPPGYVYTSHSTNGTTSHIPGNARSMEHTSFTISPSDLHSQNSSTGALNPSPTTVSPTEFGLLSDVNAHLNATLEELDFDKYLRDPDEDQETESGVDNGILEEEESIHDPFGEWTDYMIDGVDITSDIINPWAEEEEEGKIA